MPDVTITRRWTPTSPYGAALLLIAQLYNGEARPGSSQSVHPRLHRALPAHGPRNSGRERGTGGSLNGRQRDRRALFARQKSTGIGAIQRLIPRRTRAFMDV